MIAQAKALLARGIGLAGVVLLTGACAGSPASVKSRPEMANHQPPAPATNAQTASVAASATTVALEQVGISYRYGGDSPTEGFDCSGLVHYAYRQAGLSLPRTTSSLWSQTRRVSRNGLRAGDLVFFNIEGKMQHVGLYIGDDRFVHAPSTGRTVSVESLSSPFYSAALLSGGRPK